MSNILRHYQERAVLETSEKLASGIRKVVFQLATGGGKTVVLSTIANRFLKKSAKKVVIIVHREELLGQTRRTLFDWYGIIADTIEAGKRTLDPNAQVYVAMCETINNRFKKPHFNVLMQDVGMAMIDECHIGNFKKLLGHFNSYIIGFSATPLSATKKDPLKNYYEDIVCGVDIPTLIAEGSLVQNHTYAIKNINRAELSMKNGEFDEGQQATIMKRGKQVQNTVDGYIQYSLGKKALVFNVRVDHSLAVNDAFLAAGFNSRHLDASATDEYRKDCFRWLKETPDAILNNVGIATTGFDDPSVQTIIVNRATASMPLWLQMTGRGSRPYEEKEFFTIIDMGGNAIAHGDWSDDRDWVQLFHNPPKPGKGGVAPVKDCPKCNRIVPASTRKCPECGFEFPIESIKIDESKVEFMLVTKNLNVNEIINKYQYRGTYFSYTYIMDNIVYEAKRAGGIIDDAIAIGMLDICNVKCKEWCKLSGRKFNVWHQNFTKEKLLEALQRDYGWRPSAENKAFELDMDYLERKKF